MTTPEVRIHHAESFPCNMTCFSRGCFQHRGKLGWHSTSQLQEPSRPLCQRTGRPRARHVRTVVSVSALCEVSVIARPPPLSHHLGPRDRLHWVREPAPRLATMSRADEAAAARVTGGADGAGRRTEASRAPRRRVGLLKGFANGRAMLARRRHGSIDSGLGLWSRVVTRQ